MLENTVIGDCKWVKMKILYLCTFYHSAFIFRDAMNALMKRGHEVFAFNAAVKGSLITKKFEPIMDEKVLHRECFGKMDRFFFFEKQRKLVKQLCLDINVLDYQLIHAHTLFNGGYAAYRISKRNKIPYVVTVRNTDLNVFLKLPFFNILAERIVSSAGAVQFLSKGYQELFIERYISSEKREEIRKKSHIIGNGLEEFWLLQKAENGKKRHTNHINLICVGTVNQNKNMLSVLAVVDELELRGYQAFLTIVGDVTDPKVWKRLQQHSNVTILDFMKKEELIQCYDASDIYIMPSIHESFGRVYAEAMTRGLPVIYTKGQGFDGIFEEGVVGYSTPYADVAHMADCVIKICNNYEDISKRCVENSEIFDWKLIAKELEMMYQGAVLRES